MPSKFVFTLERPARKGGGDRYECKLEGDPKPWMIYFPQSISRDSGVPKAELTVTIDN